MFRVVGFTSVYILFSTPFSWVVWTLSTDLKPPLGAVGRFKGTKRAKLHFFTHFPSYPERVSHFYMVERQQITGCEKSSWRVALEGREGVRWGGSAGETVPGMGSGCHVDRTLPPIAPGLRRVTWVLYCCFDFPNPEHG